MSNVVSINLNRASLQEMALYIQSLDQSNATNCWHIAETLAQAKEVCEDDGVSWPEYVSNDVGYGKTQANNYVQVYNTVGQRGGELAEKGCSFSTLHALSARGLSKPDRKRLIDKMSKKKRIDQKYGVEIQAEIRAALPASKKLLSDVSAEFLLPDFRERLEQVVTRDIKPGPAYLFALDARAPVADIKIIAKHWKQKYHPDKGGSSEEFDAICRAEEAFIEQQNEKRGSK